MRENIDSWPGSIGRDPQNAAYMGSLEECAWVIESEACFTTDMTVGRSELGCRSIRS